MSSGLRTFFWSRTAIFEIREDPNTGELGATKVAQAGVRKIVTPVKVFDHASSWVQPVSYVLFEDGRLRDLPLSFGPRNPNLLEPGGERRIEHAIPDFNHPPANPQLADWRFRDISSEGWMRGYTAAQARFCLVDENGDLYRYESPTSDNGDDIDKLTFPPTPDFWL